MNLELLDTLDSYYAGIRDDIKRGMKYLPKKVDARVDSVNKYEVDVLCDPIYTDRTHAALVARRSLSGRTTVQAPGHIRVQLRRRVTQEDRDERFDDTLGRFLRDNEGELTRHLQEVAERGKDGLGHYLSWYTESMMDAAALWNHTHEMREYIASPEYTREGLLGYLQPIVEYYETQLLERQPWAQRSTSWSSNYTEQSNAKAMQKVRELYHSLVSATKWGID